MRQPKKRTSTKGDHMTSKYKYVMFYNKGANSNRKKPWKMNILFGKLNATASFATEREAALAVDKKLIQMGEEPVNILKRKTD